jgi:hypothetical protein
METIQILCHYGLCWFMTYVLNCSSYTNDPKFHDVILLICNCSAKPDCFSFSIQALLYRLSGDYNPLHSDPMIAQVAGYVTSVKSSLCCYCF